MCKYWLRWAHLCCIAGIRKSKIPVDNVDGNAESALERQSDEEDVDKVVASVSRPRSAPSSSTQSGYRSGTLLRSLNAPGQEILIGGTSSNGNELAILGFTNRNDYWVHSAFGRSRVTAIMIAFMAISCLLYCLFSTTWVYSGIRMFHFYNLMQSTRAFNWINTWRIEFILWQAGIFILKLDTKHLSEGNTHLEHGCYLLIANTFFNISIKVICHFLLSSIFHNTKTIFSWFKGFKY